MCKNLFNSLTNNCLRLIVDSFSFFYDYWIFLILYLSLRSHFFTFTNSPFILRKGSFPNFFYTSLSVFIFQCS